MRESLVEEKVLEESGNVARSFAVVVAVCFFLVGLFNLFQHEPWRDEMQAWLIARDSRTFAELLENLRYDGHPPLWYFLLYALTRATTNPLAMQLLHLSIATIAAFVFARFAPFTRLQRSLFCFGYFAAYEYAIISRNYALGVLCVFVFCALLCARIRGRGFALGLTLGLLANTSAYGFMIAWAFASMLAYERIFERKDARGSQESACGLQRLKAGEAFAGAVLFAAASASSAWLMFPPADGGNVLGWRTSLSVGDLPPVFAVVWRAFAPLPRLSYHLWNGNALGEGIAAGLLGLAFLFASAALLRRKRAALFAYLSGVGAILLFTHMKFYGSVRHHGHVYILFVACLWIGSRLPERFNSRPVRARRMRRAFELYGMRAFTVLLAAHVSIASVFFYFDWRHPFSQSREASEFIRREGLEDHYIVADMDAMVSPLAAYLVGRKFHYLRTEREGSFIIWDWKWGLNEERDLIEAARRKAYERGEVILVVSNYRLRSAPDVEPVKEITGSIVGDEDYYLYVVKP